jgi:hypothetical protein
MTVITIPPQAVSSCFHYEKGDSKTVAATVFGLETMDYGEDFTSEYQCISCMPYSEVKNP